MQIGVLNRNAFAYCCFIRTPTRTRFLHPSAADAMHTSVSAHLKLSRYIVYACQTCGIVAKNLLIASWQPTAPKKKFTW